MASRGHAFAFRQGQVRRIPSSRAAHGSHRAPRDIFAIPESAPALVPGSENRPLVQSPRAKTVPAHASVPHRRSEKSPDTPNLPKILRFEVYRRLLAMPQTDTRRQNRRSRESKACTTAWRGPQKLWINFKPRYFWREKRLERQTGDLQTSNLGFSGRANPPSSQCNRAGPVGNPDSAGSRVLNGTRRRRIGSAEQAGMALARTAGRYAPSSVMGMM